VRNFIFVVIPLLVFTYMALNGIVMTISPPTWARWKWTAKGQYGYSEVAKQVNEGKSAYWRFAGLCMALLSITACILVISWALQITKFSSPRSSTR
jgi:hypothetical protein